MKPIDVVIIGGSLAGAACARELTRRGIDTVAFERDHFPREKVCGGFLSPGAVNLLEELGLADPVRRAGATTVRSARVRMGKLDLTFDLPGSGMGISRKTLDAILADHPAVRHGAVRCVERDGNRFRVQVNELEISARIVIDAAGKLSRFTPRRSAPQFGVQFYEPGSCGDVLDFQFFESGYGGTVSVEGGRSNACFLVPKDALRKPTLRNLLVTGPIAYDRGPAGFIAIGDAAGMVDPFCGEGMRHALDTGLRAARIVAEGLTRGSNYDAIRQRYERECVLQWGGKKRLSRLVRRVLQYPQIAAAGFRRLNAEYWLRKLWS